MTACGSWGGLAVMIEDTLTLIVNELDESLRRKTQGIAELAVLTSLVDASGAAVPEATDRLAVFVVNIEREVIPTRTLRRSDDADIDRVGLTKPPVHLNLMVMFAANFSGANYNEALKLIEHTILFFQARSAFTAVNTPGLDPDIEQLTFEIENLSITDLSNLWGVMGGKYVPSVLYRVRLITIDGRSLETQPRRVREIGAAARPMAVG